jgi:hypothetical protein
MHVLQAIYFRFRQQRKTADQTHGIHAGLPVDSGCGGRLPNSKVSLVCCLYSLLPTPRREVNREQGQESSSFEEYSPKYKTGRSVS